MSRPAVAVSVGLGVLLLVGAGYRLASSDAGPAEGDTRPAGDVVGADAQNTAAGASRERRKRVQKYPELDALWDRARQHFAAEEWAAGLALLAAARRAGRRFFEDPDRQTALLAAEDSALFDVERLLRRRSKEAGLSEVERLRTALVDAARLARLEELRAELEALVELTGQAKVLHAADTPADRAQLERHLRRFAPGADAASPERADWVDTLLARVPRRRYRRAKKRADGPIVPLPLADEEAVEARRVLQLEKLRQREAVGLLDHIHAGLAWLALHQGEDGKVSDAVAARRCKELGHKPCAKKPSERYASAATALTVLAFLDFRDQDTVGLFEPSLSAGVDWLLAQQNENGSFPQEHGYTPAIVMMALGQAASSSGREDVKRAVTKALVFYAGKPGQGGGYRYGLGQPGDLSATGWYVQALEAARDAGVEPPPVMLQNLRGFVHSCRTTGNGWSYLAGQKPRKSLQAVGMLSELILEAPGTEVHGGDVTNAVNPDDEHLDAWRADLAKRPRILGEKALAKAKNLGTYLYTLYYEVRVQLALDGKLSEGRRQRVFLLADKWQAKEGDTAGMFTLGGGWVPRSGSALQTAFSVLTLEHALYRR